MAKPRRVPWIMWDRVEARESRLCRCSPGVLLLGLYGLHSFTSRLLCEMVNVINISHVVVHSGKEYDETEFQNWVGQEVL